jgi:catechol 2,3-dioxygenase-like lactoylglutathione lyase family enzyme
MLLVLAPPSRVAAQLLPASAGPVVFGHYHLNTMNMDAQRKFWVDTLGGTDTKIGTGNLEIIKFPGALIFFHPMQAPTGGTKGSSVDHVGFSVIDLRAVLDMVKANGFRVVTAQEAPSNIKVTGDIGQAAPGPVSGIAYVMGPDDIKVELVELKAQKVPVMAHHVHFFGPQQNDMRDWYIKVFGAMAQTSTSPAFIQATLPGIALNFTQATGPTAPTKGRAIDHIGFEVTDLDSFAKKLEAMGIQTMVRNIPAINTKIAFITDPWGTEIELSDGLRQF